MVVGVQHRLIIHQRVDSGDRRGLDTECFNQGVQHRHDGIGCARRCRYNAHVTAQCLIIDAINNRRIDI